MTVGVAAIGATFRIEGRGHRSDHTAKTHHHRLDHVVAPDAKAIARQLRRQMPVAEMPREPDQAGGVRRFDFHEFLRLRFHRHEAPVLKFEGLPVPENHGRGEVEQDVEAVYAPQHPPPPVPQIMVEDHGIRRRARPLTGLDHPPRTEQRFDHSAAAIFDTSPPSRSMKSMIVSRPFRRSMSVNTNGRVPRCWAVSACITSRLAPT